jgi:hypothetical protein
MNAHDNPSTPTSNVQKAAGNSRRFAIGRENRKGHDANQIV